MIRVTNLNVRYQTPEGDVHAVRGIDLDVPQGQFFTLLGPSGCGKTTTLRCLAGLETPDEGDIEIDGQAVFSAIKHIAVPAYKRDIGMVFQSYAIWPHMSVFENAAFPLREERPRLSREVIRERVRAALALVQLEGLEDRPAPFLSGGQQQRLALARALVREPKVLLLDEPLSNLDAKLREETRVEVRELVKRLGITTVYVTHDQLEALTMSDVVAVMDQGRIVQLASPEDIYQRPANRFVAGFIGQTNLLAGQVSVLPANGGALGTVNTAFGAVQCVLPDDAAKGQEVGVIVRPEDIHVRTEAAPDENALEGEVATLQFMGEALECEVAVGAERLRFRLHPSTTVEVGHKLRLGIPGLACRALVR